LELWSKVSRLYNAFLKPFDELVFSYLAALLRPVNGERLNLRFIRSRAISIC
jgi:hypothetical protein